jgi:hypothetical protein
MSKVGNWSSLHDQRWDTFANMTNASFWYKIRGLSWAGQVGQLVLRFFGKGFQMFVFLGFVDV